jgi:hypothetical protein
MSEMIAPFVDIGRIGDNHYLIKAYISMLLRTTTFWNNLHQVHSFTRQMPIMQQEHFTLCLVGFEFLNLVYSMKCFVT